MVQDLVGTFISCSREEGIRVGSAGEARRTHTNSPFSLKI